MTEAQILGTAIRKARKKRGLRLREVAAALEVGTSAIAAYEVGRSQPSGVRLLQLAILLDIDLKATAARLECVRRAYVKHEVAKRFDTRMEADA